MNKISLNTKDDDKRFPTESIMELILGANIGFNFRKGVGNVQVALKRTIVANIHDCCFENLHISRSHHQSQVESNLSVK